jgi:hypothetical protein
MSTAWWWKRLDENDLMMRMTWWWRRLDDENDLMMKTIWWWERLDDENDLMIKTIYLSTLNWADKELFLIFLYIASLEQTWQNPSNINPRVELRALISSTRPNIHPRVGFELLFETQFYDQANHNDNDCLRCRQFHISHLRDHLSLSKWRRLYLVSQKICCCETKQWDMKCIMNFHWRWQVQLTSIFR